MRVFIMLGLALLVGVRPTLAQDPAAGAPWFAFGPNDTAYALVLDTTVAHHGRASLLLHSLPGADSTTWIASQQVVNAIHYRTKRIRLRAHLQAEMVSSAGLWLTVDGYVDGKSATLFDDSLTTALHGTVSWREVTVVFDVDSRATCIRYGSMLNGLGDVWLDDISFDTVPTTIPVTRRLAKPIIQGNARATMSNCRGMIAKPTYLDFEGIPH